MNVPLNINKWSIKLKDEIARINNKYWNHINLTSKWQTNKSQSWLKLIDHDLSSINLNQTRIKSRKSHIKNSKRVTSFNQTFSRSALSILVNSFRSRSILLNEDEYFGSVGGGMGRAAIVGFSCVLLLLWMPAVMGATGLAPVDPGAAPPGVPVPAELSEPAWKFAM